MLTNLFGVGAMEFINEDEYYHNRSPISEAIS